MRILSSLVLIAAAGCGGKPEGSASSQSAADGVIRTNRELMALPDGAVVVVECRPDRHPLVEDPKDYGEYEPGFNMILSDRKVPVHACFFPTTTGEGYRKWAAQVPQDGPVRVRGTWQRVGGCLVKCELVPVN